MQVSAFYCRIKALLFKGWIGLRPTTQQLWNMSEHLPESFLCFYKSFTVLKHTACYLFMLQYFFSTQSPCVLNFHFCILQVIKNWRCRRLGNEAADMSTVPLKNSSVRERTWILGTRPGKVCLRNYPVRACAAGVKQCLCVCPPKNIEKCFKQGRKGIYRRHSQRKTISIIILGHLCTWYKSRRFFTPLFQLLPIIGFVAPPLSKSHVQW